MTILQLIGAIGIAYGPALALFMLTIAIEPLRIIVMMSGMFFWLLSLLLSSLWWIIVYPLKDQIAFGLTFSILFQEIFRYFLYVLLSKAKSGLQQFSQSEEESPQTDGNVSEIKKYEYAYVSGLGFGIMSGLFALINILDDSSGPGTVGLNGGNINFLITSASLTMFMVLLHTLWNVIFFWGLETKRFHMSILVVLSHFLVSELTLIKKEWSPQLTITVAAVNLFIMTIIAFGAVGGSASNMVAAFSCKRRQYRL